MTSGNRVSIETYKLADGHVYMFRHSHLQTGSVTVSRYQDVGVLDTVAKTGNTGYSEGPHLHWAVRRDKGISPSYIDVEDNDDYSICPFQAGVAWVG